MAQATCRLKQKGGKDMSTICCEKKGSVSNLAIQAVSMEG